MPAPTTTTWARRRRIANASCNAPTARAASSSATTAEIVWSPPPCATARTLTWALRQRGEKAAGQARGPVHPRADRRDHGPARLGADRRARRRARSRGRAPAPAAGRRRRRRTGGRRARCSPRPTPGRRGTPARRPRRADRRSRRARSGTSSADAPSTRTSAASRMAVTARIDGGTEGSAGPISVPAASGPQRVLDPERDAGPDERPHRARVEHLGPEVGQLGGLLVAQARQRERVRHLARVGREHAVDVGPDHALGRVERAGQDGRGVVAARAAQRRRDAVLGRGHEAGDDGDRVGRDFGERLAHQPARRLEVDGGLAERVVGADERGRVEGDRGVAGGPERGGDERDRRPLAGRHDGVAEPGVALAEQRDPVEQLADLGEQRVDLGPEPVALGLGDQVGQGRVCRARTSAQDRPVLAGPPDRGLDGRQQPVGDAPERRRHDDAPVPGRGRLGGQLDRRGGRGRACRRRCRRTWRRGRGGRARARGLEEAEARGRPGPRRGRGGRLRVRSIDRPATARLSWPPAAPVAASVGALAQLVERLNGIEEVSGSNPLGSTPRKPVSASRRGRFSRFQHSWKIDPSRPSRTHFGQGSALPFLFSP